MVGKVLSRARVRRHARSFVVSRDARMGLPRARCTSSGLPVRREQSSVAQPPRNGTGAKAEPVRRQRPARTFRACRSGSPPPDIRGASRSVRRKRPAPLSPLPTGPAERGKFPAAEGADVVSSAGRAAAQNLFCGPLANTSSPRGTFPSWTHVLRGLPAPCSRR